MAEPTRVIFEFDEDQWKFKISGRTVMKKVTPEALREVFGIDTNKLVHLYLDSANNRRKHYRVEIFEKQIQSIHELPVEKFHKASVSAVERAYIVL